jgi:hypothetical protein
MRMRKTDLSTWSPSETDVQWLTNLMNLIKEGGTWGIPATNQVFIKRGNALVHKPDNPTNDDEKERCEVMLHMVTKVAEAAGLEVKEE